MSGTEAFVNVTEGAGKKLHTVTQTISASSVHDEIVQLGEQYLATWQDTHAAGGISIATANDHTLEIVSGASNATLIRRIQVWQQTLATTAAIAEFEIWRTSTAGTGGTALTPRPLDSGDGAAGHTAMTLPTVKGTETQKIWGGSFCMMQTAPTAGGNVLMFDIDFDKLLRAKYFKLAAGVTIGIAFKNVTAVAAAKVIIVATVSEASFL